MYFECTSKYINTNMNAFGNTLILNMNAFGNTLILI